MRTLRAALKSVKRDGAGLLREAKNRAAVLAAKNRQYVGTTYDRLYRKYEEQVRFLRLNGAWSLTFSEYILVDN